MLEGMGIEHWTVIAIGGDRSNEKFPMLLSSITDSELLMRFSSNLGSPIMECIIACH